MRIASSSLTHNNNGIILDFKVQTRPLKASTWAQKHIYRPNNWWIKTRNYLQKSFNWFYKNALKQKTMDNKASLWQWSFKHHEPALFLVSDTTSESLDSCYEAALLSLIHPQLSRVALSGGLQTCKRWQEVIMLLTCCATSLFMRTDSSLQMAAHQHVLYSHMHTQTQGRRTPKHIHATTHSHVHANKLPVGGIIWYTVEHHFNRGNTQISFVPFSNVSPKVVIVLNAVVDRLMERNTWLTQLNCWCFVVKATSATSYLWCE